MNWLVEIDGAAARIAPHVDRTPVLPSPELDLGAQVWLKCEHAQRTGSFKVRGATNAMLSLPGDIRERGVVTASSGNHGAGVACAAHALGCPALVFVPENTSDTKVDAIRSHGAIVEHHGDDCVQTEAHARATAEETGRRYLSPYNDFAIIAGQGTIARELLQQIPNLDVVVVAVGGGGLISGIGAYLAEAAPQVQVIAASPARSPAMHACLEAGAIIDVPCEETLSDSTAGGVEPGAVTFNLCQRVISRSVLVDESAIAQAMRTVHRAHGVIIEGAAGVAVAAWQQVAHDYPRARVAIISCGGNISPDKAQLVLAQTSTG